MKNNRVQIEPFIDDKTEEYDYKILIYGNYTYRKNLEADSLVEVLRHVIPFMSKQQKIHFTIPIPEYVESLNFPNVEQIIYKQPTYINTMRQHFNATEFMKVVDWRHNDWDIVYTHLPEHSLQIANCFHNATNIEPKIIGYSHWFEVPENAPYGDGMPDYRVNPSNNPVRSIDLSVAGLLVQQECGVNSDWLKQLTIKEASKHYNQEVLDDLQKIIQPHYLGVDRINIRKEYKDKTVIFNHRGAGYTGWAWFCEAMDEIWSERQDFKVYTTMASPSPSREWHEKVNLAGRDEYMDFLSTMKFGVGTFEDYSAWSISTTDGFSVGVPYLLPNKLCYPEMVAVADEPYPYLYDGREDFKKKFKEMLDNPIEYDTENVAKHMVWEERISKWFNNWENVFDLKPMGDTEGLQKCVDFIKKKGVTTKHEMITEFGWGYRVKFNNYRNALREMDEIKFTKDGYEWVGDYNE